MKNPNGYGSVAKLSGNRRRPYIVRKTEGFDGRGYPIYKIIGYFETREEGLIALAKYNENLYDVNAKKITLSELFEKWLTLKAPKLPKTTVAPLKAAKKHALTLGDVPYCKIEAYMMQDCIDDMEEYSLASKAGVKNFFYHMDRLAQEMKIITIKNSDLIVCKSDKEQKERTPFTYKEIERVWENLDYPGMNIVATLLYTGFRTTEFLTIKTENVDLDNGFIKGGIKTKAGKGRMVPIHPQIAPVIEAFYRGNARQDDLFFTENGRHFSRSVYYSYWSDCMSYLQTTHVPHECRHTLRSELDRKHANKVCIDRITGHQSKDVGEKIYTHKTPADLAHAMSLVTYTA